MAPEPTILVPLDGSELAEYAVPVACAIAQGRGATVRLVHVHVWLTPEPIYVEGLPVIDEEMRSRRREHEKAYLERTRARLVTGVPCEVDLLEDPVAAALAHHAARTRADLIVMTTHGRGGFERLWLGSVADELVRRSPVPLLLLRPEEGRERPASFRRVLVPLDGSPLAESILLHALALVRAEADPELVLFHVVDPVALVAPFPDGGSALPEEITEERVALAHEYLDQVARRLSRENVAVRTCVRTNARVAPAILKAAREHETDAIALATHGRTGVVRATLGSVADKLVRGSHVPVLLRRPAAHP